VPERKAAQECGGRKPYRIANRSAAKGDDRRQAVTLVLKPLVMQETDRPGILDLFSRLEHRFVHLPAGVAQTLPAPAGQEIMDITVSH
jgi:hypothetical protein